MGDADPRRGRRLLHAALALMAVGAALIVGVGIAGAHDLIDEWDDVLPFVFVLAALAAIAAWAHERRAAQARAALDERRRGEMDARAREAEARNGSAADERDRLARRLAEQQRALRNEQKLRLRSERARQAEREWARELREQVIHMYRQRGPTGDLRELVLAVAVELTGAEKGLLLSRADEDSDGRLDLVAYRGFDHDPERSTVAQRFAHRVIERDTIVREDHPGHGDAPSDAEIQCLVAVPVYMSDDFQGVVVCANRPGGFEELDDHVLLSLGDHAGAVLENHRLHGHVRRSYLAVVRMLADAIEAKDPFARARSDEVSATVEAVGGRLGFDPRRRERLVFASLLHDVGKLGISDRVLLKPGPLSSEEREVVELHALIGSRIVERAPGLAELAPAIRHHHERWDGGGYPGHLVGEQIPLDARVLAVADAFAAMTSTRPYRRAVSFEEACREIERCAGSQFDPEVARLFVEEVRRRAAEEHDRGTLAASVDVPAVQAHREADEPLLGHGPVAAIDHLTLLYSHRHLQEVARAEASRAVRRRLPFAVLMIELADLSEINRRDGYGAGDSALLEAARALERAVADTPATVGRYSGRRLAAILPGSGHQGASELAGRLMVHLDGAGPRIHAGIAVWQHGDHGEDVLARAALSLRTAAEPAPARLTPVDGGN